MNDVKDFYETVQSNEFKKWQKEKRRENEERLHVDLSTRKGLIAEIMDLLDQLGLCVQTNAQRNENGLIMYDENGEPLLIEGETKAKVIARTGLIEALGGNKHDDQQDDKGN